MVLIKISKNNGEPSATNLVLLGLNKTKDVPFEILMEYGKMRNQFKPTIIRTAISRLKRKKLIFSERRGKKIIFALTDYGEKEVEKLKLKFNTSKIKHWDRKWRIIIFDIPEKLRGKRDILRKELVAFGFKQLQKSVWAYPNPLPKEFIDLWKEAGILKHCIIFETDKLENGEHLEALFFKSGSFGHN